MEKTSSLSKKRMKLGIAHRPIGLFSDTSMRLICQNFSFMGFLVLIQWMKRSNSGREEKRQSSLFAFEGWASNCSIHLWLLLRSCLMLLLTKTKTKTLKSKTSAEDESRMKFVCQENSIKSKSGMEYESLGNIGPKLLNSSVNLSTNKASA